LLLDLCRLFFVGVGLRTALSGAKNNTILDHADRSLLA